LEILFLILSVALSNNGFFLGVPFIVIVHGLLGWGGDFLKKKPK
jgi:hypothetical protein